MTVAPATRIRTRSTRNVDTERLLARLDWLRVYRWALFRVFEHREPLRAIAREAINIERELTRRDEPFVPITDGRHLLIDVHEVPEIRPR